MYRHTDKACSLYYFFRFHGTDEAGTPIPEPCCISILFLTLAWLISFPLFFFWFAGDLGYLFYRMYLGVVLDWLAPKKFCFKLMFCIFLLPFLLIVELMMFALMPMYLVGLGLMGWIQFTSILINQVTCPCDEKTVD